MTIQAIVKNEIPRSPGDYYVSFPFDEFEITTICHLGKIKKVFFTYEKTLEQIEDNSAKRYEVTLIEDCQLKSVNFPNNCFIEKNWSKGLTFSFYVKA